MRDLEIGSIQASKRRGPRGAERPVALAFVGDLMLGRRVAAAALAMPPDSFWSDVLPFLAGADAVLANLECPITEPRNEWRRCWKAFRFRAEPCALDILKAANVRFVSLANNHILDHETEGLYQTMGYLDGAGIAHAGAGSNSAEAMRPALFEADGVTVGAIALTDNMVEFAARPDTPGTNYVPIRDDHATLRSIETQVRDLRAAGARIVVLSAHWGPNLRPWPSARFKRFARAVVDLGVDVFHGHSAHLLHGLEIRNRRLILYDTGDFIDDYWVFPFVRTDRSCAFFAEFGDNGLSRLRVLPVSLQPGRVRLARGREGRTIAAKLLRASRPYFAPASAIATELHLVCAERMASTAAPVSGLGTAMDMAPCLLRV